MVRVMVFVMVRVMVWGGALDFFWCVARDESTRGDTEMGRDKSGPAPVFWETKYRRFCGLEIASMLCFEWFTLISNCW
jgi:hypothetical protein